MYNFKQNNRALHLTNIILQISFKKVSIWIHRLCATNNFSNVQTAHDWWRYILITDTQVSPPTLLHMLSSVPDTNKTGTCSGSPLRSSDRCIWACVCPGGCRGKDRHMTPRTSSSDSSLSCLARAAAARHPIDLPANKQPQSQPQYVMDFILNAPYQNH